MLDQAGGGPSREARAAGALAIEAEAALDMLDQAGGGPSREARADRGGL